MIKESRRSETVILGAGLAGLSTAYHLEHGCSSHSSCRADFSLPKYSLFEKEEEPGGMARSVHKDGYTFDYDGHLLHFRDGYALKLVSELLNGNMAPHKRNSWIFSKGIYTRYPFQANFYGLPKPVVKDCLMGLIKAKIPLTPPSPIKGEKDKSEGNGNFENWIIKTFGKGIADHFMIPYNRKFWTVEPNQLTCEWLDGFVPVPDLEDTVTGAISDNTKLYGYNSRFWYPVRNGISELTKGFLERVRDIHVNKKAVTIDQHRREIIFEDATIKRFKNLITTIPLPELFNLLVSLPQDVRQAFSSLRWTSILVLNLGIKNEILSDKHWIYYPEEDMVFYRIGFPTSFSVDVAPARKTSLYVEVAYSNEKKIDKDNIMPRVIEDLKKAGIISDGSDIEALLPIDIKYGYVIYDFNRRNAVHVIKDYLERFGIHPIGRYGSWGYMSMEDVILEGRDVAEQIKG